MLYRKLSIGLVVYSMLLAGCGPAEEAAQSDPPPTPATASAPVADSATDSQRAPSIDIPNARMPFEGILVGGQPTPEQLEAAAQAGYSTIVNLRPPGENSEWEEASKAAELGLRYVNIPIAGVEDLNAENAARLAEVVDDPAARPLLVHCGSGNRVGALFALKAFYVDGEDAASALQTGLDTGLTSLEDAVRQRLSQ